MLGGGIDIRHGVCPEWRANKTLTPKNEMKEAAASRTQFHEKKEKKLLKSLLRDRFQLALFFPKRTAENQ